MKCQECMDFLTEYIDGRLPDSDTARVIAHLKDCADCRGLEAELRATVALVGSLERRAVPASLADAISSKLERRMLLAEERPPKRKFILTPLRLAGVGAALAAALLVAFHLRTPQVPAVAGQPKPAVNGDAYYWDGKEAASSATGLEGGNPTLGVAEKPAGKDAQPPSEDFSTNRGGTATDELRATVSSPGKPAGTKGIETDDATLYRKRDGSGGASVVADTEVARGLTEKTSLQTVVDAAYDSSVERADKIAGAKPTGEGARQPAVPANSAQPAAAETASTRTAADKMGIEVSSRLKSAGATAHAADLQNGAKSGVAAIDDLKKAEEQRKVAEATFYFTGKSSAAARQLLLLFPDGSGKALGEVSPEAIKTAATARGITVVELTDDKAVFEFTADAGRIRTVTGDLSANAGLSPSTAYSEKWPVEEKREKALNQPETEAVKGRIPLRTAGEKMPVLLTCRVIFARRPKEIQPATTTGTK